jgi:hypothetical protein
VIIFLGQFIENYKRSQNFGPLSSTKKYARVIFSQNVDWTCHPGVVKQLDLVELQNESVLNEFLSANEFQMRDIAFIPDNVKPDIDRESDAKTNS